MPKVTIDYDHCFPEFFVVVNPQITFGREVEVTEEFLDEYRRVASAYADMQMKLEKLHKEAQP